MLNLFKKSKSETIFAPVDGIYVPLTAVNDPVFSQKMMGDGFGVQPNTTEIYAPIQGKITTIFQTKHAIGLISPTGNEVLMHIGLDTVELAGHPFTIHVQEEQEVDETTLLASVNFEEISSAGKDGIVLVLLTNSDEKIDSLEKTKVIHSEPLIKISVKK